MKQRDVLEPSCESCFLTAVGNGAWDTCFWYAGSVELFSLCFSESMTAECCAERCHEYGLVRGSLTEKQLGLRCKVYLLPTPLAVVGV